MWLLELTDKRPDEKLQQAIDDTIKNAQDKWGLSFEGEYPTSGIGITTLRPFHVEGNSLPNANTRNIWNIVIAAANTWQDWVNVEINENVYVILGGLFNNTTNPSATELAFKANGIDLPVQNVQQMYSFEKSLAWFSKPFVVAPENNLTGRLYGSAAQTELMGLLGFAIAKRSRLIQES
jgi:hypothetical protein